MDNGSQAITQQEAKLLVKHMARDIEVPTPKISFLSECADTFGDYSGDFSKIRLFGEFTLNTLVHEFAHHVQFQREGATNHRVGFHRICFELRDYLKSCYGIEVRPNSYTNTQSYLTALDEWFKQKAIA